MSLITPKRFQIALFVHSCTTTLVSSSHLVCAVLSFPCATKRNVEAHCQRTKETHTARHLPALFSTSDRLIWIAANKVCLITKYYAATRVIFVSTRHVWLHSLCWFPKRVENLLARWILFFVHSGPDDHSFLNHPEHILFLNSYLIKPSFFVHKNRVVLLAVFMYTLRNKQVMPRFSNNCSSLQNNMLPYLKQSTSWNCFCSPCSQLNP